MLTYGCKYDYRESMLIFLNWGLHLDTCMLMHPILSNYCKFRRDLPPCSRSLWCLFCCDSKSWYSGSRSRSGGSPPSFCFSCPLDILFLCFNFLWSNKLFSCYSVVPWQLPIHSIFRSASSLMEALCINDEILQQRSHNHWRNWPRYSLLLGT